MTRRKQSFEVSALAALCLTMLAASVAASAGARVAAAGVEDAAPQPSVWQHHQSQFTYFGFTSIYTCDGLEGKVRDILRYFGARDGMKIDVESCPRGPDSLSRSAWVTVQFDTLAAAAADAAPADIVQAKWTPVLLSASQPYFMGEGECELIDEMHKLLTQNFSLRNLAYSATCTPHAESLLDFRVRGEVLKATAGRPGHR